MAQGLLHYQLRQAAHRLKGPIDVESAGVFAIEGMSPSKETIKLLQPYGVDLSSHMARPLREELVKRADLIFVMEQFQMEEVLGRFPDAKGKVHLLKRFGLSDTAPEGDPNPNIPDPIGKPMEVYEVCFATIQEAVERVAKHLISS